MIDASLVIQSLKIVTSSLYAFHGSLATAFSIPEDR